MIQSSFKPSFLRSTTKPSVSSCISVVNAKKDEIYVDIFEKLTVRRVVNIGPL